MWGWCRSTAEARSSLPPPSPVVPGGRAMDRECACCRRRFTPDDLVPPSPWAVGADRGAGQSVGVRFQFYHCPGCGSGDMFAEAYALLGESPEAVRRRQAQLEAAIRRLRGDQLEDLEVVAGLGRD